MKGGRVLPVIPEEDEKVGWADKGEDVSLVDVLMGTADNTGFGE